MWWKSGDAVIAKSLLQHFRLWRLTVASLYCTQNSTVSPASSGIDESQGVDNAMLHVQFPDTQTSGQIKCSERLRK